MITYSDTGLISAYIGTVYVLGNKVSERKPDWVADSNRAACIGVQQTQSRI